VRFSSAFFVILLICAVAWIFDRHPEYIEQLKSADTREKLQSAAAQVETMAQKTLSEVEGTNAGPVKPAAPPFVPPDPLPQKDNWTWVTSTGKVYNHVKVVKVEADCVTILHDDGGGRIDTSTLPPDIQRLLNYNPVIAQDAAAQRSDEMSYTKQEMAKESVEIQQNELNAAAISNAAPVSADPNGPIQFEIDTLQKEHDTDMAKAASYKSGDGSAASGALATAYEQAAKRAETRIQYLKTKLVPVSPPPVVRPSAPATNNAPGN
jgi:hypothetical protein